MSKKIKSTEAKKYIDEYLPLKKQLKLAVLSKVTQPERDNPHLKIREVEKYFHSEKNAFIFDGEQVMDFLKNRKAKFLMVMLAAKYKGQYKSEPTIVLTGVNKSDKTEEGTRYRSLDVEYPALEQPPSLANARFPGNEDLGNNKILEFLVKE